MVRESSNCVSTSRLWGRSCHRPAHTRPSACSAGIDSCSQLNLRNGCNSIMTRKARFRQTRVRLPSTWHSEDWNSVHVAETQYVLLNSWRGVELGAVHTDTRFERIPKTSVAIVVDSYTRFGGGTPWPMHLPHLQYNRSTRREHEQPGLHLWNRLILIARQWR